jgi:hypothetical protein
MVGMRLSIGNPHTNHKDRENCGRFDLSFHQGQQRAAGGFQPLKLYSAVLTVGLVGTACQAFPGLPRNARSEVSAMTPYPESHNRAAVYSFSTLENYAGYQKPNDLLDKLAKGANDRRTT